MSAPDPEQARKYRPVTLWFLAILGAVAALLFAGEWLRRKLG